MKKKLTAIDLSVKWTERIELDLKEALVNFKEFSEFSMLFQTEIEENIELVENLIKKMTLGHIKVFEYFPK